MLIKIFLLWASSNLGLAGAVGEDHSLYYKCYRDIGLYTQVPTHVNGVFDELGVGPLTYLDPNMHGWGPESAVIPNQVFKGNSGYFVVTSQSYYFVPYIAKPAKEEDYFKIKLEDEKKIYKFSIYADVFGGDNPRLTPIVINFDGGRAYPVGLHHFPENKSEIHALTLKKGRPDKRFYKLFARYLASMINSADKAYQSSQSLGLGEDVYGAQSHAREIHKACDGIETPIIKDALARLDRKFAPILAQRNSKASDAQKSKQVSGDSTDPKKSDQTARSVK